jgi:hypothetical protein
MQSASRGFGPASRYKVALRMQQLWSRAFSLACEVALVCGVCLMSNGSVWVEREGRTFRSQLKPAWSQVALPLPSFMKACNDKIKHGLPQ